LGARLFHQGQRPASTAAWKPKTARTLRVEFSAGASGVTVRETFDAESTHSVEQQREGWQAILNNFARHVEGRR